MIDFSQLDRTIHEKGRLAIMTLLSSRAEPWAFQDLKAQLDMSDGNLITHLRTLEKAMFIAGEKLTGDGRPQTLYVGWRSWPVACERDHFIRNVRAGTSSRDYPEKIGGGDTRGAAVCDEDPGR